MVSKVIPVRYSRSLIVLDYNILVPYSGQQESLRLTLPGFHERDQVKIPTGGLGAFTSKKKPSSRLAL